ncbi:MAG: DNA mismatch repair endonuclease MutL [Faecalibacterium sp.]|nr:DNA mismatch repair endonuclease MutL [Ruminococcus sp.]MCM1391747.1 DNA mismatch repair endonuclease MutL [Ruminococcus sp.]MCM1485027.1 DNA mismatch repair endonuclease MutL [Faecalibacterium sp.]
MARINILPKNIAELIAAGEVVERPASVVKELVENSIDSGASTVTVEIQHGGITYIRITDNGCGIYHEDVPKAFLSHATSKVSSAQDLNSIFTLGFRGEALASVAVVSRVEMFTKSPDEDNGTCYCIEGGEQLQYETAGCPNGTTIVVRDLFYNTPARMKFLKKDISEANAVADVVDKLALSHPDISFRFIRDGKQALLTPGDSKLISAVYAVYGKQFADGLIETEYELDEIKVNGLICKPVCSRASRTMQVFFLNGRYIKSRSCTASLENAYKNSIMVGKFPGCVLNIIVPNHDVDVNVHPAKTEVRFSDEKRVYSAVYYAAKSALEELDTRPQLDINKIARKSIDPAVQLQMVENDDHVTAQIHQKSEPKRDFWRSVSAADYRAAAQVASPKRENPYILSEDEPDLIPRTFPKKAPLQTVKTADEKPLKPTEAIVKEPAVSNVAIETQLPPKLRIIGEAFKTYIICECDEKLYIIDKHAAHERVIFNRLKKQHKESSQMLLSPVTVTLSKNEYSTVIENLDAFSDCGFLVEDFGKGTVIVRECPMMISVDDAQDTVVEIAANLMLNKTDVQSDKIDTIFHTTACKAAIKAGNNNTLYELEELAKQVLFDDNVRYCPHGRPVLIELSQYDLEKQFGRIQ